MAEAFVPRGEGVHKFISFSFLIFQSLEAIPARADAELHGNPSLTAPFKNKQLEQ